MQGLSVGRLSVTYFVFLGRGNPLRAPLQGDMFKGIGLSRAIALLLALISLTCERSTIARVWCHLSGSVQANLIKLWKSVASDDEYIPSEMLADTWCELHYCMGAEWVRKEGEQLFFRAYCEATEINQKREINIS